ncbi:hypothetical protein ACUIJQ_12955 [Levilactobacillus hammesii]|uniref:Uncharacterized protein n=1 Tax=Levilactobacillus hammesii DSM 16381 TaxID=1423753 RepID=A0A0R1UYG6_9LACO|nr:hypothetical protein [Levilactobacillus hammesii]KRL98321.1 hypothetical protein FD28_GL000120 [Levilactobacillus hammesii DSM 16381]
MLTTDFDVKLKLIILAVVGLLALAGVLGYVYHLDHHFNRRLVGVIAVMIVLVFALISLLLIHH